MSLLQQMPPDCQPGGAGFVPGRRHVYSQGKLIRMNFKHGREYCKRIGWHIAEYS
jgi:hypothetical protein